LTIGNGQARSEVKVKGQIHTLNPLTPRVPDTFANILIIKHNFGKYLNESLKYYSSEQSSFRYFLKSCSNRKLFAKVSDHLGALGVNGLITWPWMLGYFIA